MKEKYIKLKSVIDVLYDNKTIDDSSIDPNAITEILALPTEEIEDIKVNQDSNVFNDYDSWNEMLNKLLAKPNPYDTKWTLLNESSYIPEPCKACPNHPSNGGSGICHCILGLPKVTY